MSERVKVLLLVACCLILVLMAFDAGIIQVGGSDFKLQPRN